MIEYYHVDKVVSLKRIKRMECDNCETELKQVFPDTLDVVEVAQPGNALQIELHGGYGQYIDGGAPTILLCGECATLLCNTFPCFARAVEKSFF